LSDAIRRHVVVIATPANTPGTLAAKAATSTIPIVFGVGEDPVALGLVASLAQPGGNTTGINFFASEIDPKRLGLMHELLPKAKRLTVLVNPANPITEEATTKALKEAAPGLGLELLFFKASIPADIDAAFAAIANAKADDHCGSRVGQSAVMHNTGLTLRCTAVCPTILSEATPFWTLWSIDRLLVLTDAVEKRFKRAS
jgi:putative ABC transport system substrate-binding protein